MITKEFEQAYISSFVKIFTVLKENYELYVEPSTYDNYEICVKKINDIIINDYLSICFQKQNASLTVISDNNVNTNLIKQLIKDITLALNEEVLATYNLKDSDYNIYHFSYMKNNELIDNEQLLKDLYDNNEIINLKFKKA